jgi:EAL domain-containing protein (putative c-di-GMP-specific phosphodiesterase class I)
VNVSPRQLLEPALVADVEAALADSGLPATRLVLEITETAVMHRVDDAVARLEELTRLGVRIAIDDFGTGHSSLAYLRRLPVSALKLARPFVRDLETSPPALALARGIVALGHSLQLKVVAEGIEETGQRDLLRDMACDLGQGYLYARPMGADAIEAELAADGRGTVRRVRPRGRGRSARRRPVVLRATANGT